MNGSEHAKTGFDGRSSVIGWVDPGWLFVILGIVTLSAGILLPAIQENRALNEQLRLARLAETRSHDRLARSAAMLDQLQGDEETARRIWNADLNRSPLGSEPLLRDLEAPSEVLQWLDASTSQSARLVDSSIPGEYRSSMLERLACGPRRLWFIAAGGMCLCLGLVIGPSASPRN